MAAAFSVFSSLPAELRNQIWQDALPNKVGQALYFYRKGCWGPRHLTEAEVDYVPEDDELNWSLEFLHNLLDYVQFEMPLFCVNREARSIAYSWIHEQGLKIYFHKSRQSLIFIRPFDPKHDTLYVPLNKWTEFLCEPFDRLFQPDLKHQHVVCYGTALTRIAVPEAVLQNEVDPLLEFFEHYFSLEKLFIVVNTQPDLQPEDNNMKVQRRWELESTRGATFFWNTDRGSFEGGDGEDIGDKALFKLIVDASNGLDEKLKWHDHHGFEIRPVLAIRR
ncbi:hypothetical protein EMCG_03253 [[Emmonsia] crescens]|uniref:2EXR domain-containing protein n=1 Tax=[Emmonsia] crescens TaxID=73230 RepID=A0A0G2HX28_9EURO|nr:hypothetical protein EMCG_03253 [Emmonsia crescens UAMH 3008]